MCELNLLVVPLREGSKVLEWRERRKQVLNIRDLSHTTNPYKIKAHNALLCLATSVVGAL